MLDIEMRLNELFQVTALSLGRAQRSGQVEQFFRSLLCFDRQVFSFLSDLKKEIAHIRM